MVTNKKKTAVKAKTGCKRKPVRSDGKYKYSATLCHECGGKIDLASLYYTGKDRYTYCQDCSSDVIAKERKGLKPRKYVCAKCGGNRPEGTGKGNLCTKCARITGKPVRSDSKPRSKFVHEIEAKDIGKGFVHCDERPTDRKPKVINMRDLMGRAQRRDIGKRIYRVGSIYQVENDEQLAKRKRK